MTHAKREKRKSPSNPRLQAEGWHELEPTQLIERAKEKLRETVRDTANSLAAPAPAAPKGP